MDVRERQSQAAQIEALIQEIAAFPDPQARAKTEELLHALLEMYGEGLKRLVELTAQAGAAGQTLLEAFAKDEVVESLLLLHGLHPIALETRIREALDKVRSSAKTQGSTIELLRVEDGAAYLRVAGSGRGCSASTGALRQRIEEAIYSAAPDLDGLHFEESPQGAVPLKFVPRRKDKEQTTMKPSQEQNQATVSGTR